MNCALSMESLGLCTCTCMQAAVEETREQCSESVLTVNQVHSMLQATIAAVKSDVRHAVS